MPTEPGEEYEVREISGSSARCVSKSGAQGWVPLERLDIEDDSAGRVRRRMIPGAEQSRGGVGRHLMLSGASNVRDLGGYFTKEGRRVRRGLLYRADSLAKLTRTDLRILAGRGLSTVVDFREEYEVSRAPDRVPPGAMRHWIPVNVGGEDIREELRNVIRGTSRSDTSQMLVEVGKAFVIDHADAFASWFRLLLTGEEPTPHLFHCSAGKDRTGFAAAVMLLMLGVPVESVTYDYLATNRFLTRFVQSTIRKVQIAALSRRKAEFVRPLLIADERYLRASIDTLNAKFGSVDGFARHGLALSADDVGELRRRFLESTTRTDS